MKKTFLVLLVLAFLLNSCQKNPDPENLIRKFSSKKHDLFQIAWQFSYKSPIKNDTITSKANAWVKYNARDTNWYADLIVSNENGNIGIYYKGKGYEYNTRKNTLTLFPQKYAKYAANLNNSEFILYFTNPKLLESTIKDSLNKIQVLDTTFNNQKTWALKIKYPDKNDRKNNTKILFFDRKNYNLIGIESKSYIIWGWQWSQVKIDSLSTNLDNNHIAKTIENLKQKAKLDTLKLGGEQEEESFSLLQIGTLAPEIYGHIYQTKDTFVLSKQNAKLYVIDFWYQTCSPCMKSIPYLIELYDKYKKDGLLVIGVNSIDNTPNRYPLIKKFIEFKNITYPIIMSERKIDINYKVPGYPTLYVLDQNKHIIFYEVGFNPDKKLYAVDSIVKTRLK